MKANEPLFLVIFGASGDLTRRKLMPALLALKSQELLPDQLAIVGVSRTEYDDASFRKEIAQALDEFAPDKEGTGHREQFLKMLFYQPLDTADDADYIRLKEKLETLGQDLGMPPNYLFYLATPPFLYDVIPFCLAEHGLHRQEKGFSRLIIEKPFGTDLSSAKNLNQSLREVFEEDQLYRIDHYLGKETVQNLLVTRFANGVFEPLWNRNYVDHIEITSAEFIGVGGRGGYYDSSGALRDMVQNHLLQLVGMVAMEPPTVIDATAIRNETMKVFQALRPIEGKNVASQVVRGQYLSSKIKGEQVPGYREEQGVPQDSRTETYAALKFYIDNWRWGEVPFTIRTGKRLPTRVTEIVVHFKPTPHRLFATACGVEHDRNHLVIRIQPNEGILLKTGMKVPGAGFRVDQVNMDFQYKDLDGGDLPEAYERLLLDAMKGDATLFTRGDAVEAAWAFIDPIEDAWSNDDSIPLYGYPSGTWGPPESRQLLEDNQDWRYPCRNLTEDGNYCEL